MGGGVLLGVPCGGLPDFSERLLQRSSREQARNVKLQAC